MLRMLNAALSEGTKNAYKRYITSYVAFSRKLFPNCSVLPASTGVLATYIAILFSKHYVPATLMTYMSALTYIKKLSGMPTQHSVITKLLAGAQKLAGKPDTRLLITPRVLCQIVDSTQFIASSDYLRYMLQSRFLLAFHAFLRIGEITVHSRTRSESVIQLADVTISHSHIVLVMCHIKHNTYGRPVTLLISQHVWAPCHSAYFTPRLGALSLCLFHNTTGRHVTLLISQHVWAPCHSAYFTTRMGALSLCLFHNTTGRPVTLLISQHVWAPCHSAYFTTRMGALSLCLFHNTSGRPVTLLISQHVWAPCHSAYFTTRLGALSLCLFHNTSGRPVTLLISHTSGRPVTLYISQHVWAPCHSAYFTPRLGALSLSLFHNKTGRPVTLLISHTHNKYCPVQALSQSLKVRGSFNGPLFAFANASPVSRNYFCQYLRKALQ